MTMDTNDPRLTAYVLGELDEAQRQAVEAALDGSPQLRRQLEAIREGVSLLSQTLQAEPCPTLTDEQRAAIDECSGQPPSSPAAAGAWNWSGWSALATAACLLLIAGALSALLLPPLQPAREAARRDVEQSTGSVEFDEEALGPARDAMGLDPQAQVPGETGYGEGGVGLQDLYVLPPADPNAAPQVGDFAAANNPGAGMGGGGFGPAERTAGTTPSREQRRIDEAIRAAEAEVESGWKALGDRFSDSTVESRPMQLEGLRVDLGLPRQPETLMQEETPRIHIEEGEVERLAERVEADSWSAVESDMALTPRPHDMPQLRLMLEDAGDGAVDEPAGGRAGATGGEDVERLSKLRRKSTDAKARSWRPARATPNASRLMVGDQDDLPLEGMQVNVLVDGFRARVLLDLYYFNDRGRQLEGDFQLRLPSEASLYYFAFGQSAYEYRPQVDQLAAKGFLSAELVRAASLNPQGIRRAREDSWAAVKEARVVPREKAAHAYSETVRRRVDPALVEWSGAGVFNARVFPLMPGSLHRIVVGYDTTLEQEGEDLVYRLDLPAGLDECFVDLNVSALPGTTAQITPHAQPFMSGGRAYYHFNNPAAPAIGVRLQQAGPVMLAGNDPQAGDFFATRFTPALPAGQAAAGSSQAIFLVDTSLSSRPERFNLWLELLEQVLTQNRDAIHKFAVLFFNIETHWWQEAYAENTVDNVNRLLADCHTLSLEGATDLRQALREAASPAWAAGEDGQAQVDLFLLSDGAATWGETNVHQLSRAWDGGGAGALFAYKSGLTGTATDVLEHIARESGGAVFAIAGEDEIRAAATAHRQRPWQLVDVTVPGGSDLLVAGRPQSVYPGQPLLIVGRGRADAQATLRLRRGDEEAVVETRIARMVESELASRLYGQVAVGQLEDLGHEIEDVAVAYARHFRVTGRTCSLLMLDSEADYARFNIRPEDDALVVRSTPSAELIAQKLDELAQTLSDAKALLTAWLDKLEHTAGMQFELPTALRLAIERLPREAFEVPPQPLACRQRQRDDAAKQYLQQLQAAQLDYDTISAEAARRLEQYGAADALRTLSNLIESNPADPVLLRDVAFSAVHWGLSDQAYPLLRRVVSMRPYEPQTYQAIAGCLAEAGRADLAMIYYEVVLHTRWHDRYQDVHQIAGVEYLHLLRQIARGELTSHAEQYVAARLDSLAGQVPIDRADLVVTMMWNTDRTDVDLHVLEPTGEECFYDHPRTRIGGRITRDVTEGYGPEMYWLPSAKPGSYKIMANYFGSDANRTQVRSKVYLTIYEDLGGKTERISKRVVTLSDAKEKREVAEVKVAE